MCVCKVCKCVCVCVRKRERVKSERVKGILVNYTPVSVMSGQKTIKLQSFVFFTFGFIFCLFVRMQNCKSEESQKMQ